MQPDRDLAKDPAALEVDDRDRALVRGPRPRIDLDQRPLAGGAGDVSGNGPRPSPVRDVGPFSDENDVERERADVERPEKAAVGRVEFPQPVGEVEGDVDPLPVLGNGDPRRDLLFAPRGVRAGQGERFHRRDRSVRGDGEDLDAPVDVAEVDRPAVGGKGQPGEAQLALVVGLEDVVRGRLGIFRARRLGRKENPLPDRGRRRIDDDQLGRFAGRDEDLSVGAQGQGLGSDPGELDLLSGRGRDLVHGEDRPSILLDADGLGRGRRIRASADRHRTPAAAIRAILFIAGSLG